MDLAESISIVICWCLKVFCLHLARLNLLPPLSQAIQAGRVRDHLEGIEYVPKALDVPVGDPLQFRPEILFILFLAGDIRKASEYNSDFGILGLQDTSGGPLIVGL